MNATKNVFLIGPGFIGWNVLELLVGEGYRVAALVRRESHGENIKRSGAVPITGDLNDYDLIKKHSYKNCITFHTATADHLSSVQAVLDGVRQRISEGKPAIFIHTSGTGVLDDGSCGNYVGKAIYVDTDPESIDALPDTAPHRRIDLAIVHASKEIGHKAKFAIMIPPTIYGFNPSHRRLSVQIPALTRFALKHGYAGHVGKGLSVESQIHVFDLARAYVLLLHHIEITEAKEVQKNPYFFCENGCEFSWKEVSEEIGKSLQAKGLIKNATPREIERKDWSGLFGNHTGEAIGLNSRSRAVRLRELGWKPQEKGIWESFNEDELPEILRQEK